MSYDKFNILIIYLVNFRTNCIYIVGIFTDYNLNLNERVLHYTNFTIHINIGEL